MMRKLFGTDGIRGTANTEPMTAETGLRDVFDARHNPVWRLAPSADACRALLAFFRERPEDGAGSDLTWSFAVPADAPDADHVDRGI